MTFIPSYTNIEASSEEVRLWRDSEEETAMLFIKGRNGGWKMEDKDRIMKGEGIVRSPPISPIDRSITGDYDPEVERCSAPRSPALAR